MKNKKIIIGVCGGIAAYKICSLVNNLKSEGAEIKIVMTEAATKFVSPLTFQSLSNNPVYMDMLTIVNENEIEHISLAKWCDVFVIAPATANTIGKIANGIADNLLTTITMALPKKIPVVIAPAMNTNMWENEINQSNIKKLKQLEKYKIIGPGTGKLACGDKGEGTLIDIKEIISLIKSLI